MISLLPLELFDLINQQLSTKDRFQCLFVCQSWHQVFHLAFYQNCLLTSQHSYQSFYTALKGKSHEANNQYQSHTSLVGQQVRQLNTSQCDLSLNELQSLFQLCPNLRASSIRWHPSFWKKPEAANDLTIFSQSDRSPLLEPSSSARPPYMWYQQSGFPVCPATNTKFTDRDQPSMLFQPADLSLSTPPLFLCDSLTQLTLHNADLAGFFSLVTQLPLLEQLSLVSAQLDMTLADMESIHISCPRLVSLSMDLHTLLPTVNPLMCALDALRSADQLTHLKLVYKHLEKPGRTPWIQYLQHKYPYLASLELQTRFVRRRNYWQWNGNGFEEDHHFSQQQQQQYQRDMENKDDHPDFRSALKRWAQSCYRLDRIHLTGIPWDRWFLQHLPSDIATVATDRYQTESQSLSPRKPTQTVQQLHVVQLDDDFHAASATFWVLTQHPLLNQLKSLTLRPVATVPDESFYKALGGLKNLVNLTIHQQGVRSNKQSPCQMDIWKLLQYCCRLDTLDLGGLTLTSSLTETEVAEAHRSHHSPLLRSLTLSTVQVHHATLQYVISNCPTLDRFTFISCEYHAPLDCGVPTLSIGHVHQRWKEINIRHPFIRSPTTQYHQHLCIGLSGPRGRGGTPRLLSISQHRNGSTEELWMYLNTEDGTKQRNLTLEEVMPTVDGQCRGLDLSSLEGMELGLIKIASYSIQTLTINGTKNLVS